MDDLDQFLGGPGARIVAVRLGIKDMLADMTLDDLGNQPIEGTAARGRLLQHGCAADLLLQRSFHRIELSADASDPIEQLLLLFWRVLHFFLIPSSRGVYGCWKPDVECIGTGLLCNHSQGI